MVTIAFYISFIDFNNDNPLENALVEAIFSLQENDPSFTELKLNNYCYRVDFKFFEQVMMALKNNCYVKNVSLVNLDLVDKHATVCLASIIPTISCILQFINIVQLTATFLVQHIKTY